MHLPSAPAPVLSTPTDQHSVRPGQALATQTTTTRLTTPIPQPSRRPYKTRKLNVSFGSALAPAKWTADQHPPPTTPVEVAVKTVAVETLAEKLETEAVTTVAVAVAPRGRQAKRAWPGGAFTSNKAEAIRLFRVRKGLSPAGHTPPVRPSDRPPDKASALSPRVTSASTAAATAAGTALAAAAAANSASRATLPRGKQRWQLQSTTAEWHDYSAQIRSPTAPIYRICSVFSGAGLMDFGFVMAGARVLRAAEPLADAADTYQRLLGLRPDNDIRTQVPLPPHSYHVLVAGFPCQPFSVGGLQHGFNDHSTRSLWAAFINRIHCERPWVVVVENVEGLLTSNKGTDLDYILRSLEFEGYSVTHGLTDARQWGYPFLRSRVFVVAARKELSARLDWPSFIVPTCPLTGPLSSFPCFQDFMCPLEHDPYADGAMALDHATVSWMRLPDGQLKRDNVPAHDRRLPPAVITLGTCAGGSYASRLVLSSRGALICLITSGMPFVYIHARNELRTPCRLELLRMWDAEKLPTPRSFGGTLAVLAQAVATRVAKTQAQAVFLRLDRFMEGLPAGLRPRPGELAWTPDPGLVHHLTRPYDPVPRAHFPDGATPATIINPDDDRAICKWVNSVIRDDATFEATGQCQTRALQLRVREGAAAFVWDLRGGQATRVTYRKPSHDVSLQPLVDMGLLRGFSDQNIVHVISTSGASLGSRSPPVFIAHPCALSFMLNRDAAEKDLRTEIDEGCVQRVDVASSNNPAVAAADGGAGCGVPFWPMRAEPNAIIPKKLLTPGAPTKWRRITNKKVGPLATNDGVVTSEYASQQYASVDDAITAILYLMVFAIMLGLPIVGLSGDLSRAYRRLSVPYTERWLQCSHSVFHASGLAAVFAWLVDKALQFGGRLGPMCFSRVTAALVFAITALIERTMHTCSYARKWRESGHAAHQDATPTSGEHLSARWRDGDFIHYRDEGVSLCKPDDGPSLPKATSNLMPFWLFFVLGYIDDYLLVVVGFPLATIGRAAMRRVGTLCGFIWNDEKWELGAPAVVFEFLGVIFNLTDLKAPFVQQPEKKRTELHHLVNAHLDSGTATVAELNSLSGRLLNAAKVVRHGRLHVGGVLSAGRQPQSADGSVHLGRWARRNLSWWDQYYKDGGDGRCFLRPAPTYPGLVQSDASGIGYGGFWETATHVYYFHGVWGDVQPANLTMEACINVLELATAVWLAELGSADFAGHCVQFDCDNMQSVVLSDSFKTRREAMAILLERLDKTTAIHHTHARLAHIAGVLNGPADALSRDDLRTFFSLTSHLCNGSPIFQDVTHRLDHRLSSVVDSLLWGRGSSPPRGVATRRQCVPGSSSA